MSRPMDILLLLLRGARRANHTLIACLRSGDAAGANQARRNREEAIRQARSKRRELWS